MPKKQIKTPDDGVFILDSKKEIKKQHQMKMVYTLLGEQARMFDGNPILLTDEKDEKAYAYCELRDGTTKFYIRRAADGGGLYNPCSLDLRENHKAKLLKSQGNRFLEVTEDCFKQYLEFLKSRKITHFKFAERTRQ